VYAQIVISGPAANVQLKYNESAMQDSPTAPCKYKYKIFLDLEPVGRLWPGYAFGTDGEGHLVSGLALVCLLVDEYTSTAGLHSLPVSQATPTYVPQGAVATWMVPRRNPKIQYDMETPMASWPLLA
jgi:hypothetical protein